MPPTTRRFTALIDRRSGVALPLELSTNNLLRFNSDETNGDSVVVVSLPKAGTYLVAALLDRIGLVNTGVHLSEYELTDYRGLSAAQQRGEYQHLIRKIPLYLSAGMIGGGQYAVGHLPRNDETVACLAVFKKVFLYREVRSALVSFLRFQLLTGRGGMQDAPWRSIGDPAGQMVSFLNDIGPKIMEPHYAAVAPWIDDSNVHAVSFETLMGDHGAGRQAEVVRSLCHFVGRPAPDAERVFAEDVLGHDTKTYSGERSTLVPYWSDAAEEIFAAMGGVALNRRLGYGEAMPGSARAPA